MYLHSNPKFFLAICISIFFVFSCKKLDSPGGNNPPPNNQPPNNQPPAITPVGTPLGDNVTKKIDASGGSITSDDGKIELAIPAGALSSTTDISIQSVTNETPGGIGLSYHLLPDGTTFNKPVTLTFHYEQSEVNGTDPYLLYIAFQDKTFGWKADFKNRNVDTVAKTVSLGITHFSIWTMGDRLHLFAEPGLVNERETSALRVVMSDPPDNSSSGSGSDDDLPSLPQSTPLPNNAVTNWKVNGVAGGNAQDGTVTGSGSTAVYTAPASVTTERTVQLSAELNYTLAIYNNGRLVSSVNRLILFTSITLFPSRLDLHLRIEYHNTFYGHVTSTYLDYAEMDISVRGSDVQIQNISNAAPSLNPNSFAVGLCTFSYVLDAYGYINVTGGSGYVGLNANNEKVLDLTFAEKDTHEVGTDLVCPPSPSDNQHSNPAPFGGFLAAEFQFKNEAQTITYQPGGPDESYVYKLTPR